MRRPASTPPDLPGLTYVGLLGTGGFSDVFLYDQKLPRRRVAVKVLLTDRLDTAARDAFVDEANLMAQLSAHPYIVTIFHADVAPDERPYFVMEYCSGPSLGERYKREKFGVADALRTGVRLSGAIATAHAAGILHRDIKPANVLTNAYGWPALTDFGISSAFDDEVQVHTSTQGDIHDTSGSTESRSVGMSVPWSPPEMFSDVPRPDVRSDVFALAATIHTLLAGRTPFEIPGRSNGTLDLIGRIERGVITPIGRDDVPRSLAAVLQKGMATHRSDRYATAVDFARALQRVELELGYASTTIEVPNLVVIDADDGTPKGGGDETRVRSVATIAAQPAPVPAGSAGRQDRVQAPSASPAVPASHREEETRVRPVTIIVPGPIEEGTVVRGAPQPDEQTQLRSPKPRAVPPAPTQVPPTPTSTHSPAVPAVPVALGRPAAVSHPGDIPGQTSSDQAAIPRRHPVAVVASVAALAVVAVVVAAAITISGGTVREDAIPKPTPEGVGGSAIVEGQVPSPTLGAATPDAADTSVTFTFVNPDPQDGDTFRFALSEAPNAQRSLTEGTVTLERPSVGARVCITVWILRAGRTSPAPLESCNPAL